MYTSMSEYTGTITIKNTSADCMTSQVNLQCVEEVVKLSKPQKCTCLTRASRIGDTVRDGLKDDVVKPPLINV